MSANVSRFPPAILPVLSVCVGIATFSAMDAAMKGASIALGVFTALLLRNIFATLLAIPLWLLVGRPLPSREALKVHAQRSGIVAVMACLFFYGLVRIPMAEAIAISFIAPIVALYFAALLLGETIRPRAIVAAGFGILGVLVIGVGRFGQGHFTVDAMKGTAAILVSAVLYALNLIFQRRQALLAGPVEIALFQNMIVAAIFIVFAPWFAILPDGGNLHLPFAAAILATLAILFLSWGYARAEAQVLVPIEYTGFLWAALFGWLQFGEKVGLPILAGAVLIVIGCWVGAKNSAPVAREQGTPS
jgi:S-adenosylmethionine uptake transporter